MDLGLRDRVYLLTGASAGLGLATAEALVADGARVLLSGRDQARLDKAVAELGAGHAEGLAADNADPEAAERLVGAALSRFGRLDGLLVSVGGPPPATVQDATDEQWRAAFESVFLGTIRLARAAAAALGEGGSIAFVLSTSVREPLDGLGISNGLRPGLGMAAKSLAAELGPRGIRVNALLPGATATDRMRQIGEPVVDDVPLRRVGQPDEFGKVAAFVLSPAASYVTGAMIPVDGGRTKAL